MIDEAGGSAQVFGMSSGAVLAMHAAAAGLKIRRLALYEPPFIGGGVGHQPPADHVVQLQRLIAQGRRGDAVRFWSHKVVGMPAVIVALLPLTPMWRKLKAVAHTLPYDAALMGDFILPAGIGKAISVPTLVIGGEKSPDNLRRGVQATVNLVRNSGFRELPGQTHNVSVKVLTPVLEAFFSGTTGG
jgi:pimeloyl-ACP methyl ester carboxylesterase